MRLTEFWKLHKGFAGIRKYRGYSSALRDVGSGSWASRVESSALGP